MIEGISAVLLDIDGTLSAKGKVIPGAARAVSEVREAGLKVRFVTNIDSRPASDVAAELNSLGIELAVREVFTPMTAAQTLFRGIGAAQVLPLLSIQLCRELEGVRCEPPYSHVLVGDCREILSYEVLDEAFCAVRDGAELVALQKGRYFLREDGRHFDTGGVVVALEYATDVSARVLGKPSRDFFDLAARSAGLEADACLVVGDDATTDISGGATVGAQTIQVRTGKYLDQQSLGLVGNADFTVDSIADVPSLVGARST